MSTEPTNTATPSVGTPPLAIGDEFEQDMLFDREATQEFARFIGDFNPLHIDEAFARRSRFGGLIVAGAQTTAALSAMMATFCTTRMENNVGLEVAYQFRRAVMADAPMRARWRVTSIEDAPKLKGVMIGFECAMLDAAGVAAITGRAKTLAFYAQD